MKNRFIAFVACALVAFTASHSHALVNVSFTGSSPLTVTTTQDITFTNVPTGLTIYGFVVIDAFPGNISNATSQHTGTMGWNGGGTDSNFGIMGYINDVSATPEDFVAIWLNGDQPATTSTMTLTAGSRTTTGSIGLAVPQGPGSFEIRLIDGSTGNFVGDPGTQVPEPSTYAALCGLAVLGVVVLRRRRRKSPLACRSTASN